MNMGRDTRKSVTDLSNQNFILVSRSPAEGLYDLSRRRIGMVFSMQNSYGHI